jgi:hypothetical protein
VTWPSASRPIVPPPAAGPVVAVSVPLVGWPGRCYWQAGACSACRAQQPQGGSAVAHGWPGCSTFFSVLGEDGNSLASGPTGGGFNVGMQPLEPWQCTLDFNRCSRLLELLVCFRFEWLLEHRLVAER